MICLELFLSFFRVGLFSFGGAYGAIPLIREEVLRRGWLSDEALSYMIAVSESTPGPIMVNTATYIGSSQAGFFGALLATLAVVLPSFLIILLVTAVLKNAVKNPWVQALLRGLRPCVVAIILITGCDMVLTNCFSSGVPFTNLSQALFSVMFTPLLYIFIFKEASFDFTQRLSTIIFRFSNKQKTEKPERLLQSVLVFC